MMDVPSLGAVSIGCQLFIFFSQRRNQAIHGYLSGFDPKSQRVTFTKLDGRGVIHKVSSLYATIPELVHAGGESLRLATDLVLIQGRLSDAFMGR